MSMRRIPRRLAWPAPPPSTGHSHSHTLTLPYRPIITSPNNPPHLRRTASTKPGDATISQFGIFPPPDTLKPSPEPSLKPSSEPSPEPSAPVLPANPFQDEVDFLDSEEAANRKAAAARRKAAAAAAAKKAGTGGAGKASGTKPDDDDDGLRLLKRGDVAPQSIIRMEEGGGPEYRSGVWDRCSEKWERRVIIAEVKRRGRLTKAEALMQSERQLLHCNREWLQTSTKKLGLLARQIAGKTLDDAMLQMRFSLKGPAETVRRMLEDAKAEAVVKRGMGLGMAPLASLGVESLKESGATPFKTIQLKNGKRHQIWDPTNIYIAQAWVGRGKYGATLVHRARGRTDLQKNPTAKLWVLLKEERTRIREATERRAKEERKKPWEQLPNRPVTAQHQYCLW